MGETVYGKALDGAMSDCKEDDEAEGDSCSYHDGVSCVDQAHLANTMLMLKSEKK